LKEMNDEPKTNEYDWSVEPPKKCGSRRRRVLRIALIVAALGVVAAGVLAAGAVLYLRDALEKREPLGGDIVYEPKERAEKSQMGNRISKGAEQQ
jgi:hypothetical protein